MVSPNRYIKNFFRYKDLLYELVKRDIKIKYRRSVLGIFWSFLNPLFTMIVMTMIFSRLFKRNIENFPVYLLTGRLLFDFYSQATRAAMKSIVSNASLIKKVYVPKYMYPLSSILSTFITFVISLFVLLLVMIATGVKLTPNLLLFFIPITYLLILTLGAGFILASLTVFFRDIEHLYRVFLTLLMYSTPIFYPADIIPEQFRFLRDLNPLYHIVTAFREVVLYGVRPTISPNLTAFTASMLMFIVGVVIFYRKQDRFILYI